MNKEYESPHIEVVEIEVEGVLCQSGTETNGISTTSFYGDEQAW